MPLEIVERSERVIPDCRIIVLHIATDTVHLHRILTVSHQKMVKGHDDPQHTEVERSEKGTIGIVNLCIETLPYTKFKHLILLIVFRYYIPGLVHNTPLRALAILAFTLILLLQIQSQIEVPVEVDLNFQQMLVFLKACLSLSPLTFQKLVCLLDQLLHIIIIPYFHIDNPTYSRQRFLKVDLTNIQELKTNDSWQKILFL
jgi:hypothetical protein